MCANEYLPAAIAAATTIGGITPDIVATRFFDENAAGTVPSVVWREDRNERPDTMDIDPMNAMGAASFEVECRSYGRNVASQMADDILHQLTRDNALVRMLSRYDEPDDASQKPGKYFAHVLSFSISNTGLQVF